ncbi:MAG: serine--tRNA ligase, partial [Brevundimonas sp.]
MHDIRAIRDEPQRFIDGWTSRGASDAAALIDEILALDAKLRAAQTAGQDALARRNAASKAIGAAMGKKDMAEADRLKAEVEGLKGEIAAQEAVEAEAGKALRDLLAAQKNLAADDVPDGADEAGNVEVGVWGAPRRTGPAKDHADLGEAMGLLDFEAAAKMSGARFAVLKGGLARLERAIGQFMLDLQTEQHGYQEVAPPYLVRDEAMFGTGQLPKFEEDLFQIATPAFRAQLELTATADVLEQFNQSGEMMKRLVNVISDLGPEEHHTSEVRGEFAEYRKRTVELAEQSIEIIRRRNFLREQEGRQSFLIPTAEVSLTNLVRESILPEDDIATPMRLTALT